MCVYIYTHTSHMYMHLCINFITLWEIPRLTTSIFKHNFEKFQSHVKGHICLLFQVISIPKILYQCELCLLQLH